MKRESDGLNSHEAREWPAERMLAALRAALEECADQLDAWIENYYGTSRNQYPSQQARYERDRQAVVDARKLLATPNPPVSPQSPDSS